MRPTIVFDLDGTLADTDADLINAANACFRAMGHGDVLDPVADRGIGVKGGRRMLALGYERALGRVDAEEVEAKFPVFVDLYDQNIHIKTELYPGAVAAVTRIRQAGGKVAICTNKPEAQSEKLLRSLGIRDLFDALIAADTLPMRKPDPEPLREAVRRAGGNPAHAVMIGDTITDHETARAAGVPSVLVAFGPDGRAVEALRPDAVLDHYDQLDAVIDRLFV